MIRFSILTHGNTIGKHFNLIGDKLKSVSISNIVSADIETKNITTLQELPDILRSITPSQHLCSGIHKAKINRCVHGDTDSFSCNRTNKDLPFPKGAGLMVIDSDNIDTFPNLSILNDYACVRTTSSSSMIFTSGGNELKGFRGAHTFYAVKKASDIPRALLILHKHQVINYLARHRISKVGGFLERSCIDQALISSSQPIYVHGVCGPGLKQHKIIEFTPGMAIVDTEVVLPDLTEVQEELYQTALAEAKTALSDRMLAQRTVWEKEQTDKGVSPATVRHALTSERRQLDRDFIIHTAIGERTVAEICGDPEKYHLMNCADPFEPTYGNKKTVAKIFTLQAQPMIASKAHGEMSYQLIDDLKMYGQFGLEDPKPGVPSEPSTELTEPVENTPIHTIGSPMISSEWNETYCNSKTKPLPCIENLQRMLYTYGINVHYDVIAKEMLLTGGGGAFTINGDIKNEADYGRLYSLCGVNGLSPGILDKFLPMLMLWNQVNPVVDWIHSEVWDGIDRLGELFNTIVLTVEQDRQVAWMMFLKWFRGAVMIVQRQIEKFENVLVLQAPGGGEGKTRWFETLCPDSWQTTGLMLDPKDKDSVKIAIGNWLVELGELDSTFRRTELKAIMSFLDKPEDDLRLPFARTYSKFARRTAFFGTVNPDDFLKDDSGDRRFWAISVESLNHTHGINMQQVWAQVDTLGDTVKPWLNAEEHKQVVESNKRFKHISSIEEQLLEYFHRTPLSPELIEMSATNVLENLGIVSPNNMQCKTVLKVARDLNYEVKRKNRGNIIIMPHFGL